MFVQSYERLFVLKLLPTTTAVCTQRETEMKAMILDLIRNDAVIWTRINTGALALEEEEHDRTFEFSQTWYNLRRGAENDSGHKSTVYL